MSDITLAKATIAAALIESERFSLKEIIDSAIAAAEESLQVPLEEVIQGAIHGGGHQRAPVPEPDWRELPALIALRNVTNAIYKSLADPARPAGAIDVEVG
jgi:hypothetical protein